MGMEYAPVPPEYEAPMLSSAGTERSGDSGGRVTVGGTYFNWDNRESGFTNAGWFTLENCNCGPMVLWGFQSNAEVTQYLNKLEANGQNANLTAVFQNWANWYTSSGDAGVDDYVSFLNLIPRSCISFT